MVEVLRQIIQRNRAGTGAAIPSVCSAQPDVLRASLTLAEALDRAVVIEATSNQVNQDGGYTGMQPADFIKAVHAIADENAVARERIIFGGDHLGPQAWRSLPADAAMQRAHVLVDDYVAAGFHKIHLDCSEGCANEPDQLADTQTAERSSDLARTCAKVHDDLLFVVGTEVPPPGGARTDEDGTIAPTTPQAARETLNAHFATFEDLAAQIGGLVVQPGVEFSPSDIHALPIDRDPNLLAALADAPNVTLEAHSTDYQVPAVYPRLASLGFAFQKVGPALTFAYREALYALDQARAAAQGTQPVLYDVMEEIMLHDSSKWQAHYHGDTETQHQLRHTGYADRIRYYWPHPKAQKAVQELMADTPNETAMAQCFSAETRDRADRLKGPVSQRLVDAHIQAALAPYFFAETS